MATLTFRTLGCRANQYDTNALVNDLLARGFLPARNGAEPDLVVINTCVVTRTAEGKSRKAIRRARRQFPGAKIVVVGCLAAYKRDAALDLGADFVFAAEVRSAASRELAAAFGATAAAGAAATFVGRTRAFVKIQDGCDHFCSYCIVAHLRGPMRSRPVDEVLDGVRAFADAGHREIVLTGIRTGAYDGGVDLAGLIGRIAKIPDIARIRLSSVEPMDFSQALIDCVRCVDKLCPHFHIPLQSGSERVLSDMNRGYTPEEYTSLIERVRHASPGCAVTTDVLVGYPAEGEDEFAATKNFVAMVGYSRLHVFQYSPRPGTPAAEQRGTPERVRKQRSEEMLRLSRELAEAWNRRWVGKTVEVLVEEDGTGYTPDYIRTVIVGSGAEVGKLVRVRIEAADAERLRGVAEEVIG